MIDDGSDFNDDGHGDDDDNPPDMNSSSDEESFNLGMCGEAEDSESDDDTWLAPKPELRRWQEGNLELASVRPIPAPKACLLA